MERLRDGAVLDLSAVPILLDGGSAVRGPGGLWILADVEGRGQLRGLQAAEGPLWVSVDDGPRQRLSPDELARRGDGPSFRESLTILSEAVPEGFAARVDLWCDPRLSPLPSEAFDGPWTGALELEGAGWWSLRGAAPGGVVRAWIGGLATPLLIPTGLCALPMPFAGGVRLQGPCAPGARVVGRRFTGWRWRETDRVDPCDDACRDAHGWVGQNETAILPLESRFDPEGPLEAGSHRGHLNGVSFDLALDASAACVRLRRRYDRFHGVQRARVLVDGRFAGVWRSYGEDRACRWAEDDFPLPAEATRGRVAVRVTIDPMPGTALWDAACYRALCAVRS
ncbi:MAG: hypothetical protein LDL55_03450 [Armatimonadetes bacterium]|nr:hypothetical protein [Armatimonadota bacterium]